MDYEMLEIFLKFSSNGKHVWYFTYQENLIDFYAIFPIIAIWKVSQSTPKTYGYQTFIYNSRFKHYKQI